MKFGIAIILLLATCGCETVPRVHLYNNTPHALHVVTEYQEYSLPSMGWLVMVDGSIPNGLRLEHGTSHHTYRVHYPSKEWMKHSLLYEELTLRLEADGKIYVVPPPSLVVASAHQPEGYPLIGT